MSARILLKTGDRAAHEPCAPFQVGKTTQICIQSIMQELITYAIRTTVHSAVLLHT